jgi:hypothetical protein
MISRLSSPFTILFKFVIPAAWLSGGVFILVRAFVESGGHNSIRLVGVLSVVCLYFGVTGAVFYFNNFSVKRVILGDEALYV